MGANETKVKMKSGEIVRDFEIGHAERLIERKTSWTLADQGWVYDNGHLKRKAQKEEKEAVEEAAKKKTTSKKK